MFTELDANSRHKRSYPASRNYSKWRVDMVKALKEYMWYSLQKSKTTFLLRDTSRFCADCFRSSFNQNTKWDGWSEQSLTKSNVKPLKKKIPISHENLSFEIGDFVLAVYWSDYHVFIRQIKEVGDDAFISLLQHSGKLCDSSTFRWPKNEDKFGYHNIIIVCHSGTYDTKGTGSITFW